MFNYVGIRVPYPAPHGPLAQLVEAKDLSPLKVWIRIPQGPPHASIAQ